MNRIKRVYVRMAVVIKLSDVLFSLFSAKRVRIMGTFVCD